MEKSSTFKTRAASLPIGSVRYITLEPSSPHRRTVPTPPLPEEATNFPWISPFKQLSSPKLRNFLGASARPEAHWKSQMGI
ncbi:hypothetical protein CDL15_Pgr016155 [Punica granatum]|nr:hypothetical protein CDL15_Pgr016155 [Punica granatum]